ncbi:unnamed protein product [Durusdinium trenchii]|uniref:Uncharacterized protein n=2 Tax=Durusdinium trenchii TaxID=1381693 RepID=A0ABP0Q7C5_9DINO
MSSWRFIFVQFWRLLLCDKSIHWVEPTDFKEVPSRSHLKCEVMAFSNHSESDLAICIQVESFARKFSFCEKFRRSGHVFFELPLELLDGQIRLTAALQSGDLVLASDQVRVQKWLHLSREIPAWADEFNPLVDWWDSHREGLLTMKHAHYFDLYHRHLQHFRGKKSHLLEIGVASGGSLQMWKAYFGPRLRITGVDCCPFSGMRGELEDHRTSIWIGNQEDPQFWAELIQSVPPFDIIIDDGSHVGRMQLEAFESLWPHLAPGGVYIVEDLMFGYLDMGLHKDALFFKGHTLWVERLKGLMDEMQTGLTADSRLQDSVAAIRGIHIYRHFCIIEKYDLGQGLSGLVHDWAAFQVGAGAAAPALAGVQVVPPVMAHPQ